jgi:DNA invertase Pin-like site-specific DNA recombinase
MLYASSMAPQVSAATAVYAGLVRVSQMGDRKADADNFHSERDQVAALNGAAAKEGARLDLLPSELDVSGGLPIERRPSLKAAVEGVEAGRYAGIIVAYQSRLGRDIEIEESVWRRVEAAGGRIVMALDGLDTSTVDGTMFRQIRSVINATERQRHKVRFEELRHWATEQGIWQRRQTPTGYSKDATTRKLVPDERAADVRQAFADAAAGAPTAHVATRLGMTPTGARKLLSNRVYLGELRVGDAINLAAHPPIIDADTFGLANRTRPRPQRSTAYDGPALLAGLMRCQACGHRMTRATGYYRCRLSHSGHACPAPATIALGIVDDYVSDIARRELEQLKAHATRPEDRVIEARRHLEAAQLELTTYARTVSAVDIGADAFREGGRARLDAVKLAEDKLQQALESRAALPGPVTGADVWDDLGATQRNALLRTLLSAVVVRKVGRGKRVAVRDRVRVLRFGADVELSVGHRGDAAGGIVPIPFLHADHPDVLRV